MGRAHEVRAASMAKTALMKSKLYSRFGKEIYMAAKNGSTDPNSNLTLKKIIEKAKQNQVPADVIKRNIDKAKGGQGEDYTNVRYEGFGPGGCTLIVECMTDNVNRTFGEVRSCFTKTGGKIGVTGSVTHQYKYVSLVSFEGLNEDDVLEALLMAEVDIQEIETDEDGVITLQGASGDLDKIKEAVQTLNPEITFIDDKVTYLPSEWITLDEEDQGKLRRFIQLTDDLDDVQDVFHNVDLPYEEE